MSDRSLAARLREAGPRQAARYTAERAAQGYLEVYREVLASRP
jgi:hypothetical protein